MEVASGTGEHCVQFAAAFPGVTWTPSDVDAQRLNSIRAWIAQSGVTNVREPLVLNAEQQQWPFDPASQDVAVVINMTHLVSEDVTEKLFANIAQILKPGGQWFLYGPFSRNGAFVSEGDQSFHQQLVGQDPEIGYKDVETITALASRYGLSIDAKHEMPANNLMFVFRR